jgi:hypothetical protein
VFLIQVRAELVGYDQHIGIVVEAFIWALIQFYGHGLFNCGDNTQFFLDFT